MTLTDLLARLNGVRKSPNGYTANCPNAANHKHGDRNSSFSAAQGDDGRLLIHCFAGCSSEEICTALGITLADLFSRNGTHRHGTAPKPSKSKLEAAAEFEATETTVDELQLGLVQSEECQCYIESRGISLTIAAELKWGFSPSRPFKDGEIVVHKPALAIPHYVDGKLVGIKFRTIDGKKLFSQMPRSALQGLYGRFLIDESRPDVLITEGPEDCALARTHGFNALAINAAGVKPGREDVRILSNFRQIFLIGDQDLAGRKAMDAWQQTLPAEQVIRVRLGSFKDIGELWKAAPAAFPVKLRRILRFAQGSREHFDLEDLLDDDEVCDMEDVDTYAIERLVPRFAITMLFGQEKGGKSLLGRYWGKCVANQVKVFGKYATQKMPVLVLDLENNSQDIAQFGRHFARLGRVKIKYRTRQTGVPALDSPWLLRFCERHQPLLIIDSMTKFLETDKSAFDPVHMSAFFDKLLNLCAVGATIIIIHHATRADVERYANSHQIGANVARAFAVVSEDRPRLNRVRLEGQLFRGAEPVTENLIAFPVIAETGAFGLSNDTDPFRPELENVVKFVESQTGGECFRETIKNRKGKSHSKNLEVLDLALRRGVLVKKGRKIGVPEPRDPSSENLSSQNDGTAQDENHTQRDMYDKVH